MKPVSLIVFLVIFAFGFLMPWAVEGATRPRDKPGKCPFIRPALCIRQEPPRCRNDWQCPQRQKCCRDVCGIKCMNPAVVTPGRCPVVIGQCNKQRPINHCLNDSQCPRGLKCCRMSCGNSCVRPLPGPFVPVKKQ
ncbi:antileukoproteinase-like [Hippopotamus amphibius kiboko]|uniref:antileukoproteinase-like n=1 Tax=Hippopotamus amphibius kiboko TaxID=575201 RepID=UPI00259A23A4|nr:antileukoproteinase-like [Hippopotamus amphibius kiboko]